MTSSSQMETGISVDRMQGMEAEKNSTADTETMPMIILVTRGASATKSAGKNISAISTAAALAARSGSGICSSQVKGTYRYPRVSKSGVYLDRSRPISPTDMMEGRMAIVMTKPSRRLLKMLL